MNMRSLIPGMVRRRMSTMRRSFTFFPFEKDGVMPRRDPVLHNKLCLIFNDMFDLENIKPNFFNAYQAVLDSLCDPDPEFLKGIMEPSMGDLFVEGLEKMKKEGKTVKKINGESPVYDVSYLSSSFEMCGKFSRYERATAGGPEPITFNTPAIQLSLNTAGMMQGNKMGMSGPAMEIVFSLLVEIETDLDFEITDPLIEQVIKTGGQNRKKTHALRFGFGSEKVIKLTEIMGLVPKFQKMRSVSPGDASVMTTEFLNVFLQDEYHWQIMDIDYHFENIDKKNSAKTS